MYFAYNRNHGIPVRVAATTTSLDQKEPGMEDLKKHQQQSAERLQPPEEGGAIEVWGDGFTN